MRSNKESKLDIANEPFMKIRKNLAKGVLWKAAIRALANEQWKDPVTDVIHFEDLFKGVLCYVEEQEEALAENAHVEELEALALTLMGLDVCLRLEAVGGQRDLMYVMLRAFLLEMVQRKDVLEWIYEIFQYGFGEDLQLLSQSDAALKKRNPAAALPNL